MVTLPQVTDEENENGGVTVPDFEEPVTIDAGADVHKHPADYRLWTHRLPRLEQSHTLVAMLLLSLC